MMAQIPKAVNVIDKFDYIKIYYKISIVHGKIPQEKSKQKQIGKKVMTYSSKG